MNYYSMKIGFVKSFVWKIDWFARFVENKTGEDGFAADVPVGTS